MSLLACDYNYAEESLGIDRPVCESTERLIVLLHEVRGWGKQCGAHRMVETYLDTGTCTLPLLIWITQCGLILSVDFYLHVYGTCLLYYLKTLFDDYLHFFDCHLHIDFARLLCTLNFLSFFGSYFYVILYYINRLVYFLLHHSQEFFHGYIIY